MGVHVAHAEPSGPQCPRLNPHTGARLKPGQRLPTRDDEAAACADVFSGPPAFAGSFPQSKRWEITPDRADGWASHNFGSLRTPEFASSPDWPFDNELALLLADLDCYADLCRKAREFGRPHPGPLHRYLRAGREDWGIIERAMRLLGWTEWREEDDPDEDPLCTAEALKVLGWEVDDLLSEEPDEDSDPDG